MIQKKNMAIEFTGATFRTAVAPETDLLYFGCQALQGIFKKIISFLYQGKNPVRDRYE
jgi:hypothetical protein